MGAVRTSHQSNHPTPTQALAARITPRFALLALEAYGALLRTTYLQEKDDEKRMEEENRMRVEPLDLLERE